MKNKIIISSILTIAMCVSLIAGSTFALFTSESKVNVAVSSATVNVEAVASDLQVGSTLGDHLGSATLEDNVLTITNFVPGDYVTFKITVTNYSTVAVNYKATINTVEDLGLLDGLAISYNGKFASHWDTLSATTSEDGTTVSEVTVRIELPETAGNEYQDKSCKLAYVVEAVQGNYVACVESADDFKAALAKGIDELVLAEDVVFTEDLIIDKNVNIYLNGNDLSAATLILDCDATIYGGTMSSLADRYDGMPHIIVAPGNTVTFEDVTVNIDNFTSYGAQGNSNYAEFLGVAVEGTLIMENTDIVVKNDATRTFNYCYGIAATNGTVVMNGGSIVVESVGASRINMTTAISSFNSRDTITLNNVNVVADYLGITYGTSYLVINANNCNLSSTAFDVSQGGTYVLNVNND